MTKKTAFSSGHVMGSIPGNMMGHADKGIAQTAVSLPSNAKDPGAKALESHSLGKLEASTPYPAGPVMSKDSWSGGSSKTGGKG